MTVAWVGTTSVSEGEGTTVTFSKPAAATTGDVVVIAVHRWADPLATTVSGPTGATLVAEYTGNAARFGGVIHTAIYVKRLAADTSWTVTWDAGQWRSGSALFFSGVDSGNDLSALVNSIAYNSTASTTIPSVTATAATGDGLAYFVNGQDDDQANTYTPPSGFTAATDVDRTYSAYKDNVSSGSQGGTGSATVSNTYIAALVLLPFSSSGLTSVTSTKASAWNVASEYEPIPVAFVAGGAAPSTTVVASPFPLSYPTGLTEGDLLVAIIGVKDQGSDVIPTATDWSQIAMSDIMASGVAPAAGVGEQRIYALARTVPAGGLTGSVDFTVTGANNVIGRMVALQYDATGYTSPQWDFTPLSTSFVDDTANTAWGGTGAADIDVDTGDYLLAAILVRDDIARAATPNLTLSATGATLGTLDDVGHSTVSTGGDSALSVFGAACSAGPSTAAPVATLTGVGSEGTGGLFIRIRALGIGSTTTEVSQTVDTAWAIDAQVTQTVDTAWTIASELTSVTQTAQSAWHVKALVEQTASSAWHVVEESSVTVSVTTVAAAASIPSVTGAVAETVDPGTVSVTASVGTPVVLVGTQVTATKAAAWDVLTSLTSTQTSAWDVTQTVEQTKAVAWDVTSVVEATKPTSWSVLSSLNREQGSAWNIAAQVESTKATAWNIASALTSVSQTAASAWHVKALVEQTADSAWDVLAAVEQSRASAWHVDAQVEQTVDSAWDVTTPVEQTVDTAWAIDAQISQTVDSAWNVAGSLTAVSQTAPAAWRVLSSVEQTEDTAWRVLSSVEQTEDTAWSVLTTVEATEDSAWAIDAQVTQSSSSAWNIATANVTVTSTVDTAWSIVGTVTSTVNSAWHVDGTLLAVPTGLTAVPVSRTQINLSWNSVNGATGYDIERDDVVIVMNHVTTTYPDTGLAVGSEHTYRVRSAKVV